MKVLVDTNVVMDALLGREPYFEDSNRVLQICGDKKVEGYLAAHTITNLFYYLRKHYQNEDCRDILLNLFEIFEIEQIDSAKLKTALENKDFKDFEDCLQMECACANDAKYIVTRNGKDFVHSIIPSIAPDEFCKLFTDEKSEESIHQ